MAKHRWVHREVRWLPLVVVVGILGAWYLQTMPPGMSSLQVGGWTDAAAMQVVGSHWGIAHSPGYPLYTVLANLFSRILGIVGSIPEPAWRVSFFSLASGLLALVLYYSILLKLSIHPLLAGATALLLGSGVTFWFYAVTAEVYTLNLVFILLSLRLALAWKDAARERRYLVAIGAVFGALAVHHRTGLLVAPILVVWLLLAKRDGWRAWLGRAGWIVAGGAPVLLIYLYLPLTAALNGEWARLYGDARDPGTFWFIVLSREWWGLVKSPSSMLEVWERVSWLGVQQSSELAGPVLASLGVAGLLVTVRQSWLIGGVAAVFGVFGVFYGVADLNSMLIPLTAMLSIGVALLAQKALDFGAGRGLGGTWSQALLTVGLAGILTVFSLQSAAGTAGRVDQSGDTVGVDMVESLRILAEDGRPVSVLAEGNTPLAIVQYTRAQYRLGNLEPVSATVMRNWYDSGTEHGAVLAKDADQAVRDELNSRWDQGRATYYDSDVEELALVPEISEGVAAGRYLRAPTYFPRLQQLLPADRLPPLAGKPQVTTSLQPAEGLSLVGYDQRWIFKRSGIHLRVALYWEAGTGTTGRYIVVLRPAGAFGEALSGAENEGFLLGSYPVGRLRPGEVLRDVYELRLNQLPDAFEPAELEVSLVALDPGAGSTPGVRIPIVPFPEEWLR
jgi:4-amino-4-deoxy-L-arabinose transferase-like glycosyltransferase